MANLGAPFRVICRAHRYLCKNWRGRHQFKSGNSDPHKRDSSIHLVYRGYDDEDRRVRFDRKADLDLSSVIGDFNGALLALLLSSVADRPSFKGCPNR